MVPRREIVEILVKAWECSKAQILHFIRNKINLKELKKTLVLFWKFFFFFFEILQYMLVKRIYQFA